MRARAKSIAIAKKALPVLVYYASILKSTLTYRDLGKLTDTHYHAFRAAFAQIDKWIEQSSERHKFKKLPLAIIVVQKGKSTPGAGAIPWRLEANNLSQDAPAEVREALFEYERKSIFDFKHWKTVIEDQNLPPYKPPMQTIDSITDALKERGAPNGESENHRRLKKFVGENPTLIGLPKDTRLIGYEVVLPSLDRVDILFANVDKLFPVEIKSRDVDELEFTRGIYQAVKYKSLFQAQEMDRGSPIQVQAKLVCGRIASDAERLRCQLLDVPLCDDVKQTRELQPRN